jgi:L-2-hydroxyglutarate oxidase
MVDFCRQHGIRHDVCGKIIVATEPHELPMLERLYRRGLANGMGVTRIGPEQAKEIEPHVNCLGGILVPTTGIVCYPSVCEALAEELRVRGAIPTLNTKVLKLEERFSSVVLETNQGSFESRIVINCAGLHSDRLARFDSNESARIVPFRGEYFELKLERRYLVKNLIGS